MKLNRTTAKYMQSVMAGMCLIFAVTLWYELTHDYTLQAEQNINDGPAKEVIPGGDSLISKLPSIDEFVAIVERPLFTDNRRPVIVDVTDTGGSQPNLTTGTTASQDEFLLSGIIITSSEQIALIQKGTDKKIFRMEIGEIIDGWSLVEIHEKEILLTRGNESKKLKLLVKKSPQSGNLQSTRQRRLARQQINPQDRTQLTRGDEASENQTQEQGDAANDQENSQLPVNVERDSKK